MTSKKFDTPRNWQFQTFNSRDGACIRYGFAQPKGKSNGTVVITGGYGRHIEYYFEKINNWLDRGYTVYAMDWDGQGGSGREQPDNPRKPTTKDFDHHVEIFNQFVNNIVQPAPDKPAFLSSHSKGCNIMLRYIYQHEDDSDFPFNGAILGTPLVELNHHGVPPKLFRNAVKTLDKLGMSHTPLPSIPQILIDFRDAVLGRGETKRDLEREKIHEEYKNKTDRFEMGYPTIGWLRAAFRSCDEVSDENYLKKIQTPILILTAETDSLVSVEAQQKAATLLPNGRQVIYKEARHGIWYDIDEVQQDMWEEIDRFTRAVEEAFYVTKGLFLRIKHGLHRHFCP